MRRWGGRLDADGAAFAWWSPSATAFELVLDPGGDERRIALARDGEGWWHGHVRGATAGTRYGVARDGGPWRPDPASRRQPEGVHGPSELVDEAALRADVDAEPWRGRPWREHVFEELHVGAATSAGTYDALGARLGERAALGITALELMPLAATAGARNWGYDGVAWYAPAERYGPPAALRRFVRDAHARGLAVFLDVVYNHLGPEGNYLYGLVPEAFTDRVATPWGAALDYAQAPVRALAAENAAFWIATYGFDGLRLDAIQEIHVDRDRLLGELRAAVAAAAGPRRVHLVVENDDNEAAVLRELGYDAQWADDIHHALHVLATGERDGYYADYADAPAERLARALAHGFSYQGEPSRHRGGRRRGTPSDDLAPTRFVAFAQNHDQIGNRALGERLDRLAPLPAVEAALAVVLLAPTIPLLFLGESDAAEAPFLFFCDPEPALAAAVREGRAREFAAFGRFAATDVPDATAQASYTRSIVSEGPPTAAAARRRALVTALLAARRDRLVPRLDRLGPGVVVTAGPDAPLVVRWPDRDGGAYRLDANLTARPVAPPAAAAVELVHAVGGAPGAPWSVRWSWEQ